MLGFHGLWIGCLVGSLMGRGEFSVQLLDVVVWKVVLGNCLGWVIGVLARVPFALRMSSTWEYCATSLKGRDVSVQ